MTHYKHLPCQLTYRQPAKAGLTSEYNRWPDKAGPSRRHLGGLSIGQLQMYKGIKVQT